MSKPTRDARPFLAHHLRKHADAAEGVDPNGLHQLARWVENLPANDERMTVIAATDALGYADGSFDGGPDSEELIASCAVGGNPEVREAWLDAFADAVRRYWA